uniref:DM domain-containing protein n=1 Tax=Rhabditophanes sp. KR3021 TaxID=114890 RepID=A0AC35TR96_9BILA
MVAIIRNDLKNPVVCKKILAVTKRIPRDVKRHCGICRHHGIIVETRGHECTFKDCLCEKCSLVRKRRDIMSSQIKIRRAQDKRFQRTSDPQKADIIISNNGIPMTGNMCYLCQKCKNHSQIVWKKDHKRNCPYINCDCNSCSLIETRRKLDQTIKRTDSPNKSDITPDHIPEDTITFPVIKYTKDGVISESPTNAILHHPIPNNNYYHMIPNYFFLNDISFWINNYNMFIS